MEEKKRIEGEKRREEKRKREKKGGKGSGNKRKMRNSIKGKRRTFLNSASSCKELEVFEMRTQRQSALMEVRSSMRGSA